MQAGAAKRAVQAATKGGTAVSADGAGSASKGRQAMEEEEGMLLLYEGADQQDLLGGAADQQDLDLMDLGLEMGIEGAEVVEMER